MNEIIVLNGMALSGKSTIGKNIAQKLGYIFIDLDSKLKDCLKEYFNILSIKEFVDLKGWDEYRKLEYKCLIHIFSNYEKPYVLALGGGTISCINSNFLEKNYNLIKENNGKIIYLDTQIDDIISRVTNEFSTKNRPNINCNLNIIDDLKERFRERKINYNKYSDLYIKNLDFNICCNEVLKSIKKN